MQAVGFQGEADVAGELVKPINPTQKLQGIFLQEL